MACEINVKLGLGLTDLINYLNSNSELELKEILKAYSDVYKNKGKFRKINKDVFNGRFKDISGLQNWIDAKDSNELIDSDPKSKTDGIPNTTELEEAKIDYLLDYFLHNNLYKLRFKNWFASNILVISRISGNKFITTNEDLNVAIRNWLKLLVKNVLSVFNDTSNLQTEIYENNNTEDNGIKSFVTLQKILKYMDRVKNMLAVAKLSDKLAYFSYIALSEFDQCITDISDGEIKAIQPGVSFNATKIKYVRLVGLNVIESWRDDSKDYFYSLEFSKSAMNIITSVPIIIDGVLHGNIEWNQFLLTFNSIRALQYTYTGSNTDFRSMTLALAKKSNGLIGRYKSINDLLARAKKGGLIEYHDLFKLLKYNLKAFGLSSTDMLYISNIYDYIFDNQEHTDGRPNSYFYIFKNSDLGEKTLDRNFYYDVILMLNSTEELQLQGYRYNQDGELVNYNLVNTKRDLYISSILNYISSTMNSKVALQLGNRNIVPGLTFEDNFNTNERVKKISVSFEVNNDTKDKYVIAYEYDTKAEKVNDTNKITITKNGNLVTLLDVANNKNGIVKVLYNNFIDQILSINSNKNFLELELNKHESNLLLALHIVYNYLVSCKINTENPDITLDQFKEKLSEYYKVDEANKAPQFNTNKLISPLSIGQSTLRGLDYPRFKDLVNDYVLSLGIGKDNTVRDGLNNSISTVALSQRVSKLRLIYFNLGILDSDALKPIDFLNYYYDCLFSRDFKGKDGLVKKVVEFNFAEFFSSGFLLDYYNNLFNKEAKTIGLFGDVISDKGKIITIQIYKGKKINGKDFKNLTPKDIKLHIQLTLGNVYKNIINNIKDDMLMLSKLDISKSETAKKLGITGNIILNTDTNYREFNLLRDSEGNLLTKKLKQQILHELTAEALKVNPDFKLSEYSQYVFIGDNMYINPAIVHQGLLYASDTKFLDKTIDQWNDLYHEEGKDNFFTEENCNIDIFANRKNLQLILDLLYNEVIVNLNLNNPGAKKLKSYNGGWYHHGKMVFAKIYGEDTNNPLNITELSDLRSWFDYKFLRRYSNLDTNDQFMYLTLIDESLYNKLCNEYKLSDTKLNNLNSIKTIISGKSDIEKRGILDSYNSNGINGNILFDSDQAATFDISKPNFKFQNVLDATSKLSSLLKKDYYLNVINKFLRNRVFDNPLYLKLAELAYNNESNRNNEIINFVKNRWDNIISDKPNNISEEDSEAAKELIPKYLEIFSDKLNGKEITQALAEAIYSYMKRLNENKDSFSKAHISYHNSNVFDDINSNSYESAMLKYADALDRANEVTKKLYILDTKEIYEKQEVKDSKGNTIQYDIKTDKDGKPILKLLSNVKFTMTIHPELERFNLLSHDFGELYQMALCGSYTINPSKALGNSRDIHLIEALMYGLRVKRNVLATASKHLYLRGTLNGIGTHIKMMATLDRKNPVYNMMGETDDATVWDGATFVNPFMDVLENNSLGGNAVGTDKKLFASYVNKRNGEGLILKTAGFVLTNARIRENLLLTTDGTNIYTTDGKYGRMMEAMTDTIRFSDQIHRCFDVNGNLVINGKVISDVLLPNLKRDSKGNYYIDFLVQAQLDPNNTNEVKILYDPIYIYNPKTLKWIERNLLGFNLDGEIEYIDKVYSDLNAKKILTEELGSEKIDSVYELWKLFGGEYSGHMSKDTNLLTYVNDNTSVHNVVKAMNNVGIRTTNSDINSLNELYQIIKDSQICYNATVGALKLALYNVNSLDYLYDPNLKITYFTIDTADLGVLLNAEHNISGSILSIMTLVVNALGARGYSEEIAAPVYKALQIIARNNMKGLLNGIDTNMTESELAEFRDAIADLVMNTIKKTSNTDGNIMVALAQTLKAYNDGNVKGFSKLAGKFPFSHPAIFNKLVSNIASSITKNSISIKFPGSLSVMVPSDGLVKIYNGHLGGYYKDKPLELARLMNNKKKLLLSQTEMETSYRVYNSEGKDITAELALLSMAQNYKINYNNRTKSIIMDPSSYYSLKETIKEHPEYYLVENLVAGRELRCSNYTFKTIDGSWHNIWDLSTIKELWDLSIDLKNADTAEEKLRIKEAIKNKRLEFLDLLNALGSGKEHSIKLVGSDSTFIVDKKSVNVKPYELVLGKVFLEEFDLEDGIELQNVNTKYFINKLIKNIESSIDESKYDILLKRANGKNVFIKYKSNPLSNIYSKNINGKLYRVDAFGEKMYTIPSTDIEIHNEGKNEIIYTNNILYFINTIKPIGIEISVLGDNVTDRFKTSLLALYSSDNDIANSLAEQFTNNIGDLLDLVDDETINKAISVYKNYKTKLHSNLTAFKTKINSSNDLDSLFSDKSFWELFGEYSNLINSARKLNTSFLESLKFIATRTPAQSHQSFMAMKVVGFDNSGKNSAYVSRWLIWLLGSDYDIDKVSLLGRTINKSGMLQEWSPLLNLLSTKIWDAGELIAFPTGQTTETLSVNDFNTLAYKISNKNSSESANIKNVLSIYNKVLKLRIQGLDYVSDTLADLNTRESIKEYLNSNKDGFNVTYKTYKKNLVTLEFEEIDTPSIEINQLGNPISDYDYALAVISMLKDNIDSNKAFNFTLSSKLSKQQLVSILNSLNVKYKDYADNNNVTIESDAYKNITPADILYTVIESADNTLSQGRDTKYSQLLNDTKSVNRVSKIITRKSSNIGILSDIVYLYNEFTAIPEGSLNTVLNSYKNLVDYHNNYFNNKLGLEIKGALNFIASLMYNIMISPDNLIQASTAIDDPVNVIKGILKEKEFSRLAGLIDNFDPGAISSKYLQIELTLAGKANTANAASAMKKFEGMSAALNRILNSYGENYHALISDLEILGKELKLLANTYCNDDSMLPKEIKEALNNVDLHTDAFVLLSAILSLSTDNAKDPTLSKINCGPDMLGLYTAGIMAGLDIKTLIKLMLSDAGILLLNTMKGNVITGNAGIDRVSLAISFLRRGPVNKISKNLKVFNFIKDAYSVFYLREAGNANQIQVGITGNCASYKLKSAREFFLFLQRASSGRDKSKIRAKLLINSITITKVLESITKDYLYQIKKLQLKLYKLEEKIQELAELVAKYKLLIEQINSKISELKNSNKDIPLIAINENVTDIKEVNDKINKFKSAAERLSSTIMFSDTEKLMLYDILDSEKRFIAAQYTIKNDTIESNGVEYSIMDLIEKLSRFNDETMKINKVYKLNQGLPSSVLEILLLVDDIENVLKTKKFGRVLSSKGENDLKKFIEYNKKFWNDQETHRIDITQFASNEEYRLMVIKAYDTVKDYTNVPQAWHGNAHYLGYMLSFGMDQKILQTSMSQYRELLYGYREIIKLNYASESLSVKLKAIKNLSTYLTTLRNNTFLHNGVPEINVTSKYYTSDGKISEHEETIPIRLGTERSNKTFKLFMDTKVFPWLLQQFQNNDFVKNLVKIEYSYNLDGETTINYATKAKTLFNNSLELEIFLRAKSGLIDLLGIKYSPDMDLSVADMIYLYNIIAYGDSYGKDNFSNLFEDIISDGNNKLINNYMLFLSQNDTNINAKILFDDSQKDEILRVISPKVYSTYSLTSLSTPYALVLDDSGNFRLVINKEFLLKRAEKLLKEIANMPEDIAEQYYESLQLASEIIASMMDDVQEGLQVAYALEEDALMLDEHGKKLTFEKRLEMTPYMLPKLEQNTSIKYLYYQDSDLVDSNDKLSISITPNAYTGLIYSDVNLFLEANGNININKLIASGLVKLTDSNGLLINSIPNNITFNTPGLLVRGTSGLTKIDLDVLSNIILSVLEVEESEHTCKL